jgi:hypothetical protein
MAESLINKMTAETALEFEKAMPKLRRRLKALAKRSIKRLGLKRVKPNA